MGQASFVQVGRNSARGASWSADGSSEWVALTEKKVSGQLAQKPLGGRSEWVRLTKEKFSSAQVAPMKSRRADGRGVNERGLHTVQPPPARWKGSSWAIYRWQKSGAARALFAPWFAGAGKDLKARRMRPPGVSTVLTPF